MVNIEVTDNERQIIDCIRRIEKSAYTQGFTDGREDAEKHYDKELNLKMKQAYMDGKAKAHREINIKKFMKETDEIMWIPGDTPEEEGEYLVTTRELGCVISMHYIGGEWVESTAANKLTVEAYREMPRPAKYIKEG